MLGRKRLTTSSRVALAVTTVLAVGIVLVSAVAYLGVTRRLAADLDRRLLAEAQSFASAVQGPIGAGRSDITSLARTYLSARTAAGAGAHPLLLIRTASGRTLTNSRVEIWRAPVARLALKAQDAQRAFLNMDFGRATYRAATVPITDADGRVIAVFMAALPTSPAREVATQLAWALAGAGVATLLAGFVLSAGFARASLAPLHEVASTADRITQALLTERIDYSGPEDEVGTLVKALNRMLDRLEVAFGEQRRFVADASHELRTPLAVIKGNLDLVQHPRVSKKDREHAYEMAHDEIDRMNRLVEDLLTLARLESGQPVEAETVEVEACTLLEEARARARTLTSVPIELSCPTGTAWVRGDGDQLMQAVLNLLANAAAHTPSDGRIDASCAADDGEVRLTVADTGPGIPEKDLGRLFDRFHRGSGPRPKSSGGSGLGLAITQRLVELHGGTVSAANRPEGGAVFTIHLPRIPAPDGQESREA